MGRSVDRRTKVLEFHDDAATKYAILSHRWIAPTEVDYEEIVDLVKLDVEERKEIRQRLGYRKILDTCRQAKRDGYEWVWVDTCCIDKRSSAELSEAINSMYRWYKNSRVCYAYLHDISDSSFPIEPNTTAYPSFGGWPEWFSRGWTLQEMIASRNLRFFNKYWQPIGDKKTLAPTLSNITRVPQNVLIDGLSGNRPCVAQIMSWAANRTTTRVEDRAYSLMGLLDVNMSTLYGEGKKAFHRLQLKIIHSLNDHSIFAWKFGSQSVWPSSILADDPSFFRDCSEMELMDPDDFIQHLNKHFPGQLPSIDQESFSTFPVTNRGIQIWMVLRLYRNSDSVFQAWLPCRYNQLESPATVNLALWNSNYYRYPIAEFPVERDLQFRQVYFRYQDIPNRDITFEIDDSVITENGLTCGDTHRSTLTKNILTLPSTRPYCVKTYSQRQSNRRFTVAFGRCFGRDWVHLVNNPSSEFNERELMLRGPERAQSMAKAPFRADRSGCVWIHHIRLPGSTWIVRTSRVVWEKSRIGVRMEVFRDPGFHDGLNEWKILDVEVGVTSRRVHILLIWLL